MKRVALVVLEPFERERAGSRLAAELGEEEAAAVRLRLACRVFEQVRRARPDVVAVACGDAEERERVEPWLRAFPGEVRWTNAPGERWDEAVESVLEEGDGDAGVAVVGSDCTGLDEAVFEETWRWLEEGADAVLGPCGNGGSCLVGVRGPGAGRFAEATRGAGSIFGIDAEAARAAGLDVRELEPRERVESAEGWRAVEGEVSNRRAVFFDRDGVVNRSPGPGYVLTPSEFEFEPGIVDAIRMAKERDALAILVTSQKGVGKELMSRDDLDVIHRRMQAELTRSGASLDGIYAHTGAPGDPHPPKPDPGMLLAAARDFFLDLPRSWMVGDADRDIAMGRAAGLAGTIRVRGDKPVGQAADVTVGGVPEIAEVLEKYL